jgi:hypothetical protein
MGSKCNGSTTVKTAQDSKPMTVFEWKCPHCSYNSNEDMSRAVFGDTSEARGICIMRYNLHVPSSNGDSLAMNYLLKIYTIL